MLKYKGVLTYRIAANCPDWFLVDPFVEEEVFCVRRQEVLDHLAARVRTLLASGQAEYCLAGEVFDARDRLVDDLSPWVLRGEDQPQRPAKGRDRKKKQRPAPREKVSQAANSREERPSILCRAGHGTVLHFHLIGKKMTRCGRKEVIPCDGEGITCKSCLKLLGGADDAS